MAVSENDTNTSDCNSDSSVDGTGDKRKEKAITKVIIRRLPPSMTKDTFLEQVSPLPDYDYMYFVKADLSLGEFAFSRAYINFKSSSDIFLFKERFDNYVFLDQKGNEYPAVVEFAPFSRIPKRRNKVRVDPKCGSIETDPIYQAFVESLNKENEEKDKEKPEYNIQPNDEEKPKIINTPLLDFIKQRRVDRQRYREEKREERKRREFERKRYKDEDKNTPRKKDSYSSKHSSSSKNIQILKEDRNNEDKRSSNYRDKKEDNKRSVEEKNEDSTNKVEDKKLTDNEKKSSKDDNRFDDKKHEEKKYGRGRYEDRYDKKPYKEERKYTQFSRSKETRKSDDYYNKKPSKIKLRFEKPDKSKSYPYKKDDPKDSTNSNKNEEYKSTKVEEEKTEKKVKKYSERREEQKNEIKKLETTKKQEDNPPKSESYKKLDSDNDKMDCQNSAKENDPRAQRRIRNKDRPAMQIYQPGMLRRTKSDNDSTDKNNSDKFKSENFETKTNS